jgi:hypothetical protein
MIDMKKLKFYIENNLNVLFIGEHGVGKTACIKEAFNNAKLNWLYFSGATMDPWVDFIGVPKEQTDKDGNMYLDLVRPKAFADDAVEAIFMDEFNRSHKKVRNALMELIQFKSINGRKFNNLKIVWAAVNPDSEDNVYDVEKIDPAQNDRFHIHIEVPYKPDLQYFKKKFGEMGEVAVEWWEKLTEENKRLVSPRRLDYTLEIHNLSGDVRDVIPKSVNPAKLSTMLNEGSYIKKLDTFFRNEDKEGARKFLLSENNFANVQDEIIKNKPRQTFFLPLIGKERLMSLCSSNINMRMLVLHHSPKYEEFKNVIDNLRGVEGKIKKNIESEIRKHTNLNNLYNGIQKVSKFEGWGSEPLTTALTPVDKKDAYNESQLKELAVAFEGCKQTSERVNLIRLMHSKMPKDLMSEESFDYALKCLNTFIGRSHNATILDNKKVVVEIFNHVFDQISTIASNKHVGDDKKLSHKDILEMIKTVHPELIRNMKENNIHGLVVIPKVCSGILNTRKEYDESEDFEVDFDSLAKTQEPKEEIEF